MRDVALHAGGEAESGVNRRRQRRAMVSSGIIARRWQPRERARAAACHAASVRSASCRGCHHVSGGSAITRMLPCLPLAASALLSYESTASARSDIRDRLLSVVFFDLPFFDASLPSSSLFAFAAFFSAAHASSFFYAHYHITPPRRRYRPLIQAALVREMAPCRAEYAIGVICLLLFGEYIVFTAGITARRYAICICYMSMSARVAAFAACRLSPIDDISRDGKRCSSRCCYAISSSLSPHYLRRHYIIYMNISPRHASFFATTLYYFRYFHTTLYMIFRQRRHTAYFAAPCLDGYTSHAEKARAV